MAASDGTAGLSGCHRGHVTCKGRNIYCLPLTERLPIPLLWEVLAYLIWGLEHRTVFFFSFIPTHWKKERKYLWSTLWQAWDHPVQQTLSLYLKFHEFLSSGQWHLGGDLKWDTDTSCRISHIWGWWDGSASHVSACCPGLATCVQSPEPAPDRCLLISTCRPRQMHFFPWVCAYVCTLTYRTKPHFSCFACVTESVYVYTHTGRGAFVFGKPP